MSMSQAEDLNEWNNFQKSMLSVIEYYTFHYGVTDLKQK